MPERLASVFMPKGGRTLQCNESSPEHQVICVFFHTRKLLALKIFGLQVDILPTYHKVLRLFLSVQHDSCADCQKFTHSKTRHQVPGKLSACLELNVVRVTFSSLESLISCIKLDSES